MPNDDICKEGEEALDMFIVVRGDVEVYKNEEFVRLVTKETEAFFGEEGERARGAFAARYGEQAAGELLELRGDDWEQPLGRAWS